MWPRSVDLLTDVKELLGVMAAKWSLKKPPPAPFRPSLPEPKTDEEREEREYALGAANVFGGPRHGRKATASSVTRRRSKPGEYVPGSR